MIYFDHNASTPLDPRVLEAMLPYLSNLHGNPSSLYRLGRISRSAIDIAREQLAELIDAKPGQIIFTSGGSEANHLALANCQGRIWISAIEHPAIYENAQAPSNPVSVIPVSHEGLIDQEWLNHQIWQAGDLVSIMLANNETGVIQDIAGISQQLGHHGIIFHSDAVQALGKLDFSFQQLGIQLLSLSSHKIYGPKGCGALVVADNLNLHPVQRGGDQERGLRAGTENVAAIVGFGKAAELARQEMQLRIEKISALKNRLEQQLQQFDNLSIFAEQSPRLMNTTQFGISGINGEMLLMQLDQKNIAVSSGSACSANSQSISPVLKAMAIQADLAKAAIRVSLGKDNTEAEIDQFISTLKTLLPHH